MIRKMSAAACALSLACAAAPADADEVWAVDASTDSLYVLDTDTGAVLRTLARLHPDTSRFQTPISMAIRPGDGAIFVKNNSPAIDDGLAMVDPVTGLATHIGGDLIDGSIAFDDAGTLYGVNNFLQMVTIDPATGEMTLLGGSSLPRLFGLDYNSADGFLYGISGAIGVAPNLLRIDPATGEAVATLPVSPAPTTSAVPGSLMFDSSGALLASDLARNLYEIDPDTGAVSNVRSADAGPQGMGLMIGECYADCDESGELDFFDFLCFQNEFAAQTPYADCDGSGQHDFFDFLCFQNEFAAGCP
jgi:DNA-binding beta-propeller fold protein YncE